MLQIEFTKQFKRDFKKLRSSPYKAVVDEKLPQVIDTLKNGSALPDTYYDHALSGDLIGYRECHLRPDLLLMYELTEDAVRLIRFGSHAELFE